MSRFWTSTMRRNIWRARLRRFGRTTRRASSGLTNNVTISSTSIMRPSASYGICGKPTPAKWLRNKAKTCRSASRTSAIISTRCATHSIATKECQSDQASQRPHAKLWSNNGCVARECAGPQRALKSSSACEPSSSPKTGGTSSGKKSTNMVFPSFKNINNWPHPGDKTECDRVFADGEHNRDCGGRRFCSKHNHCGAGSHDHGYATTDQVFHQRRQAIVLALQPVVLDRHVLPLNVAGFAKAFAERRRIAR